MIPRHRIATAFALTATAFGGAFAFPTDRPSAGKTTFSPSKIAATSATPMPITRREIDTQIAPDLGCAFTVGEDALLLVTTEEALIKPGGVLTHFRLDGDRALALINYGGNLGDRNLRVLIDKDDQAIGTGEESRSYAARLTVRRGGAEQTVVGIWTCGT